jgi:hypothetical protein
MVNRHGKIRYFAKSHVDSGIVVQVADVNGSSLVVVPDGNFPGVAVVLPPPPPPTSQDPNPEQCTVVAYIGRPIGPTTVNLPGDDWSQVFLCYLPNGLSTPPGFESLYKAITQAIGAGTSPPQADGTGDG